MTDRLLNFTQLSTDTENCFDQLCKLKSSFEIYMYDGSWPDFYESILIIILREFTLLQHMKKTPITWCNKPGELTVSLTFTATNGSNGSDVVVICPLSTWSSLTRINPTPGMVIRGYSQYLDCSISTCKTWSRNIEDMLQSKKWYLTSKVFHILNAGKIPMEQSIWCMH